MAVQKTTDIGAEADRLEIAINAARLSVDQEIGIWDVYGDHGIVAAQHVLSALKEARSPLLMRQKATQPGMMTVQLPRELAEALTQARNDEGDARITALLRQVAGTQIQVSTSGKLTDSGDQSKLPSSAKAATVDPLVAAIQRGGDWDGR